MCTCVCFQHAVTEIIAFFQLPQVTADDVKQIVYAGLDKVAKISRAGLQYAIEQHRVKCTKLLDHFKKKETSQKLLTFFGKKDDVDLLCFYKSYLHCYENVYNVCLGPSDGTLVSEHEISVHRDTRVRNAAPRRERCRVGPGQTENRK